MMQLLRIEFRKLFKSRMFWVILLLYAAGILTILLGVESFINKVVQNANRNSPIPIPDFSIYTFPYVWHNLTYLAGFFKTLLAFIVILFICNEFTYNTIRQNMITGLSRERFFFSKVLFLLFLSIFSTLIIILAALSTGFSHTEQSSMALILEKTHFLGAYFIEILGFMSLAMLFAFIFKRTGLAVIVFSIYYFIAEHAIAFKLDESYSKYLPLKTFGRLIDIPNTSLMKIFGVNFREFISMEDLLLSVLYTLLLLVASYIIIKKTDW